MRRHIAAAVTSVVHPDWTTTVAPMRAQRARAVLRATCCRKQLTAAVVAAHASNELPTPLSVATTSNQVVSSSVCCAAERRWFTKDSSVGVKSATVHRLPLRTVAQQPQRSDCSSTTSFAALPAYNSTLFHRFMSNYLSLDYHCTSTADNLHRLIEQLAEVLQQAPDVTAAHLTEAYRCFWLSCRFTPTAVDCCTPTQHFYSAGAHRSCAANSFDSVL
jgi:hypothetical protein